MSNNSSNLPNMMAALVEVKDNFGKVIGRGFFSQTLEYILSTVC